MTDVPATGVVGHQDYGTGLAETEDRDPTSAAHFAADAIINQYVQAGLQVEGNVDFANDTMTIGAGMAWLEYTGAVQVSTSQGGDPANWSTTWHGDAIRFPVSVAEKTGIGLDADAVNEIWLFIGPSQNDSVSYRVGSGESAPPEPSMKIAEVDTANDSVDQDFNRYPGVTLGDSAIRRYAGRASAEHPAYPSVDGMIGEEDTIVLGPENYGDVTSTGTSKSFLGSGFSTKLAGLATEQDCLAYFLAFEGDVSLGTRTSILTTWEITGSGYTFDLGTLAGAYDSVFYGNTVNLNGDGGTVQGCRTAAMILSFTVNIESNRCNVSDNMGATVNDNGSNNHVGGNT